MPSSEYLTDRLCRPTRTIQLFGDIDINTSSELIKALHALVSDSRKRPINLIINSDGGSLTEAFSIYDTMRCCPAPVIGTVIGACASSAVLILQGCEKRLMTENSTVMLHVGTTAVPESPPNEAVVEARQSKKVGERYDIIVAARTGNTVRQIDKWSRTARYFTATDALDFGFIDAIIKTKNER